MKKIIISCPSCSGKFYVNPSDIGPSGRFVRCNICEYEWLAKNEDQSFYNKPKTENNTPLKKVPTKKYYKYLVIVLLLLVGFSAFYYFEDLQYFKEIVLDENIVSDNIKIKSITYSTDDAYDSDDDMISNKKLLLLNICFENQSDNKVALERIRVIGFDKNKKQTTQITISPKELLRHHSMLYMEIKLPFYRDPPHYITFDINKEIGQQNDGAKQKMMIVKIEKDSMK